MQLGSDPELTAHRKHTGLEEKRRYGMIPIIGTFLADTVGTTWYTQVGDRAEDRSYAAAIRKVLTSGFADPYPHPYTE